MAKPLPSAPPDLKLLVRKSYLLEAACWLAGITVLALVDPAQKHLFSLCPFSWILADGCPGCGLGHAIGWLFRGNLAASWEAHPLGVPALLVLAGRLVMLIKNYFFLRNFYLNQKLRYDEYF